MTVAASRRVPSIGSRFMSMAGIQEAISTCTRTRKWRHRQHEQRLVYDYRSQRTCTHLQQPRLHVWTCKRFVRGRHRLYDRFTRRELLKSPAWTPGQWSRQQGRYCWHRTPSVRVRMSSPALPGRRSEADRLARLEPRHLWLVWLRLPKRHPIPAAQTPPLQPANKAARQLPGSLYTCVSRQEGPHANCPSCRRFCL